MGRGCCGSCRWGTKGDTAGLETGVRGGVGIIVAVAVTFVVVGMMDSLTVLVWGWKSTFRRVCSAIIRIRREWVSVANLVFSSLSLFVSI